MEPGPVVSQRQVVVLGPAMPPPPPSSLPPPRPPPPAAAAAAAAAVPTEQKKKRRRKPPPSDNMHVTAIKLSEVELTEREKKSTRFRSLKKGDAVVLHRNNRAGHHDIIGRNTELDGKRVTVEEPAVWPNTWVSVSFLVEDKKVLLKVRTSNIELADDVCQPVLDKKRRKVASYARASVEAKLRLGEVYVVENHTQTPPHDEIGFDFGDSPVLLAVASRFVPVRDPTPPPTPRVEPVVNASPATAASAAAAAPAAVTAAAAAADRLVAPAKAPAPAAKQASSARKRPAPPAQRKRKPKAATAKENPPGAPQPVSQHGPDVVVVAAPRARGAKGKAKTPHPKPKKAAPPTKRRKRGEMPALSAHNDLLAAPSQEKVAKKANSRASKPRTKRARKGAAPSAEPSPPPTVAVIAHRVFRCDVKGCSATFVSIEARGHHIRAHRIVPGSAGGH